jgi:hypothetical protein
MWWEISRDTIGKNGEEMGRKWGILNKRQIHINHYYSSIYVNIDPKKIPKMFFFRKWGILQKYPSSFGNNKP